MPRRPAPFHRELRHDFTLPAHTFGTPPGRTRGSARPVPPLRGVGTPPELRRRMPGAVRVAPGAARAAERMRLALGGAHAKLLASRAKLVASVLAVRGRLAAGR